MASPQTENWYSSFLDAQGRDSEEEAAFDGYLTTHGIPKFADPGTLQAAYAEFRAWWEASEQRPADPGPSRAELAAQQAVIALEQTTVPKSRVAAPELQKPLTAATRPAETRKPLGDQPVPGTGEAQLAPDPASMETHAGEPPPGEPHPPVPGDPTPHPPVPPPPPGEPTPTEPHQSEGRHGRRRGSDDD
jgi:hypothetical protein